MQLPVDIAALIDESTAIDAARETSLSISVYVDETAPADLVAHVRNAFASSSAHVRMTVTYLDSSFIPHTDDDLAIIVAGGSLRVGPAAQVVRAVGVPVMVVTTSPQAVIEKAAQGGSAIPDGDVISPEVVEGTVEPIELNEETAEQIDVRMGDWIVAVCRDKRLALSIAFPFMRRSLASDSVKLTSLQNAGIGLIPFIPGSDLPLMTLNQAKMVMQIAAAYGRGMDKDRWKELVSVIAGAYLSRTLARELIEFIPVLGFIIRPGVAYGGTSALGYAVIAYYEGGENATGCANVIERASAFGKKVLTRVGEIAADPSSINFGKVTEVTSGVMGAVDEYAPQAKELVSEYAPQAKELVSEYAPKIKDIAKNTLAKVTAK
jgi:uncharacterized protein (DUF697 family)